MSLAPNFCLRCERSPCECNMIFTELLPATRKATTMNNQAACTWREVDGDGSYWETDCGQAFTITEGKPSDNDMKYCCYCGKPLVEQPFQFEDDPDG